MYDCFTKEITGTLEEGWNFGWEKTTSNHSPLFISAAVIRPENPTVTVVPSQFSSTVQIGFLYTEIVEGVEQEKTDKELTTESTLIDVVGLYKKIVDNDGKNKPVITHTTTYDDLINDGWSENIPDFITGMDEDKKVYVVYKVRAKKNGAEPAAYLTEAADFNWALYDNNRMIYEKNLQIKTDYQNQINTINGDAASMTTQIQNLATRTSRIYQDTNNNLIIYDNAGIGENETIDDFLKHTYYTQYSSDGLYIRYGDETISTFNASGTLMRRMEMDGAASSTVYLTQSARGGWVWKPKVEVNG